MNIRQTRNVMGLVNSVLCVGTIIFAFNTASGRPGWYVVVFSVICFIYAVLAYANLKGNK